jgi:ACS family glucarate transporter-like MFS transporter
MCRVNVSTAGALFMQEFGLTQVSMGRIFSSFLLGYALFQIPSGMLADRWGARNVLAIATWFWVALTALQAIVGWGPFQTSVAFAVTSFMFLRFLLGVAASPSYPASAKGVSRWVPASFQGRSNGIILASVGLGSALTPPIVSYVMIHWDWRFALLASSVPALVMAFIWLYIPEPAVISDTTEIHSQGEKGRLRSINFVLLTISYTLQGYVGYIFVSWFYLYLVQERHVGLLTGAWMGSMPWVLSIISIPLGGLLSDRFATGSMGPVWGRRIVPMVGMGLSGILISVGAHTESAWIAAISLAFATAFVMCVEGPFWTMMIQIARTRSGSAGGTMNMGSNVGGLLSPVLTPVMAQYIGWENALHIAAGIAIVAAILWLGIRPQDEQKSIHSEAVTDFH